MMEGYTVDQNMLYVSEYIHNLASNLNLRRICDTDSITILKGSTWRGKVDQGR